MSTFLLFNDKSTRLPRERFAILLSMGSEANTNIQHSLIVRYRCGQDGEVRGALINPLTQKVYAFKSLASLIEVLTRAVQDNPKTQREEE